VPIVWLGLAGSMLVGACRSADPARPLPEPDLQSYQGTVAEALELARGEVAAAPTSAEAWGRYGEALFAHSLFEDALACFHEAHALDPGEFRWPYFAGITLLLLDAEGSVAMFELALDLRQDYGPLHVRLGRALIASNDLAGAEAAFERAVALAPDDSHALLGLGVVALARGRVEEAQRRLEAAAAARPDHREVHATLATVYRRLGLTDQARSAAELGTRQSEDTLLDDPVFDEIRTRGSSAVHFAVRGQELLEQGRIDEAIRLLRLAHRERPDYFDVRVDLGSALILRGDEREGIELLRSAAAEAPELLDVDQRIAELRRRREDGVDSRTE
jgi:tetratricopeptide (TPR) repeat protein